MWPPIAAALTPAKRRQPEFDGSFENRQFLSGLEHTNKENILKRCRHNEKEERLAVERQAYFDLWKFAGYQLNEHHSYAPSSASNLCGNSASLLNSADSFLGDGHFILDNGLSTSESIRVPGSFVISSTNLNAQPSVLESDLATDSRLPYVWSNVQPKSLQVSECHSQLQPGYALLTVPEQAYSIKYRTLKRETQTPWQLPNTWYGDSNLFEFSQKEGSSLEKELYTNQQECFLNAPIFVSNQSRIQHPLPQTKHNVTQSPLPFKADLHVPFNKLASNYESISIRRKMAKIRGFLYICKHALGCLEGCNHDECKLMKQILNHCLNCPNNLCEQKCAPYKKLLEHYEKCCKNDCPICPPAKLRSDNLYKFNFGSKEARTTIFTSDCEQLSVKVKMNGHSTSPCRSCASEVTDIEHACFSPQAHVSKIEEQKTLNSLPECMKTEVNQSLIFPKVNNGKLFVHEAENLNFINNIKLETKHVSSDTVVVEDGLQNMQTPSSLSCNKEIFKELTSIELSHPSSKHAILESQNLITSENSVEGMELVGSTIEGLDYVGRSTTDIALHVANLQCKALGASINSIVMDFKGENNCAEIILDSSKMKYSELKTKGLNIDLEAHQNVDPVSLKRIVTQSEQNINKKCGEAMGDVSHGTSFSLSESKLKNEPKRTVTLLNLFTPEEVMMHIRSLNQSINLGNSAAEKMNLPENQKNKSCSLCGMDKLRFQPPLRYCSACMKKINPYGIFYSTKDIDNTASDFGLLTLICNPCYTASRENIKFAKQSIPKVHLEQRINYAESDSISEELVQCDKCNGWLHEICALFNCKLNKKNYAQIEYTCPLCCLNEIEKGVREPLLNRLVIGAKELPRTKLSDHIEQWLFRCLEEERQERAKIMGKNFNEVPTAEDLVVRVVSSVDSKFEVKPFIHEIFQEEKYPLELSYKSKAVVLFQVIDSADVLLFAMYVQEYGSECSEPNRRHVCISYIDSAKYFRPEIRAVSGEALRTFVYHELLIGYLDYCKKRCFACCYIWSCPPSKDDDYIFYCHPRSQKIPKSDKLREWYQKMIKKAIKRRIVIEKTNLYDHFFVKTSESKAKITAARLPYFDRDYWPGEAEALLQNYIGGKPEKKAKKAKSVIERALRAARRDTSLIENELDALLMNNLGDSIRPMKGNFIVLFLHHTCRHCCQPIISGERWVCNLCKNVQLCERCHSIEEKLQYKDRHPVNARDKHSFHRVEPKNVPKDTNDEDETKQSEIFNTRLEFLNFCQGNHYQFDTLRRAKHSTMMILDHLHNPTPPIFESSQGEGMKNDQFDLNYYEERNTQTSLLLNTKLQSQKKRTLMDALMHASKCGDRTCTYAHCRRLKAVFHHGVTCSIRKKGGCKLCEKMWNLIFLHASSCTELECTVPRCKDLKQTFGKKLTLRVGKNYGGIKPRKPGFL